MGASNSSFNIFNFGNKNSQAVLAGKKSALEAADKIEYIDISELKDNPKNNYGMRDIPSLATMLAITGDIPPLIAKRMPDGTYMLLSGHRRKHAVKYGLENGLVYKQGSKVPVIFKDLDEEARIKGNGLLTADDFEILELIFPNRGQRHFFTPEEEAKEIELLEPIARKMYEAEKAAGNTVNVKFRNFFAEILEISESKLQRTMSLNKLAPEVKEEIKSGILTPTAAIEIANLDKDKQVEVVNKIKNDGKKLTVKALKDEAKNVQNDAVKITNEADEIDESAPESEKPYFEHMNYEQELEKQGQTRIDDFDEHQSAAEINSSDEDAAENDSVVSVKSNGVKEKLTDFQMEVSKTLDKINKGLEAENIDTVMLLEHVRELGKLCNNLYMQEMSKLL